MTSGWIVTGRLGGLGLATGMSGVCRSRVRNEARDVDPSRHERAERCFGTVRPVRRDGEGGMCDGAALRGRMWCESVGGEPVTHVGQEGGGGAGL